MGLDQLVLRRQDIRARFQNRRLAACVSFPGDAYSKTLGVPLPGPLRTVNLPRAAVLGSCCHEDLDGVLIQAERVHYPETVFRQLHEQGPNFLLTVKPKPKTLLRQSASSSSIPQDPFTQQWFLTQAMSGHHLDTQGQTGS